MLISGNHGAPKVAKKLTKLEYYFEIHINILKHKYNITWGKKSFKDDKNY